MGIQVVQGGREQRNCTAHIKNPDPNFLEPSILYQSAKCTLPDKSVLLATLCLFCCLSSVSVGSPRKSDLHADLGDLSNEPCNYNADS